MMHVLGVGAFGCVRLAVHRPMKQALAVKQICKEHVVKSRQVEHVLNERKLMSLLSHPFIVRLHATYQDDVVRARRDNTCPAMVVLLRSEQPASSARPLLAEPIHGHGACAGRRSL